MRTMCTLAAAAAGSALLLASAAQSPPSQPPGPRPAAPQASRHRGFVMPSQQVELSPPLEEVLLELHVEEGDRFEKDQVLARLDDKLQTLVVEAARVRAESQADIERTSLDVEDAELNLERIDAAFNQQAATELELRRARIDVGRARAQHTQAMENHDLAQANLRLEEERLSRYQVRAPFKGTVIALLTEAGAMLREDDNIMVVANLDPLEAQIDLPIELFGTLELGRQYTLLADHPVRRPIKGSLRYVNPLIDTASQTFRCTLEIANHDLQLPAGFTVHLEWPQ